MTSEAASSKELGPLERFLSLFAKMEPGEGLACVLNLINIFLILASYYVLKTVRGGLMLSKKWFGLSGAEVSIYAAAAMAFLLLGIVPLYGWVATKMSRIKLINSCYVVVIGCLGLFFVLGRSFNLGLVFFLWLGIVNVFLISQFWQFANDIYKKEQGERLFAVIAIGGSLGAIVGPKLQTLHKDPYDLMAAVGATLLVCVFLFNTVNKLAAGAKPAEPESAEEDVDEEPSGDDDDEPSGEVKKQLKNTMAASVKDMKGELEKFAKEQKEKEEKEEREKKEKEKAEGGGDDPLGDEGGFELILKNRYLLFIGLMVLAANLVNTTGEYILGDAFERKAAADVPIPAETQTKLDTIETKRKALPEKPTTDADKDAVKVLEDEQDVLMKPISDKRGTIAKDLFGNFFFWVNIVVLIIQSFFVSRIFKSFGVRAALYFLPIIALGGYALIGLVGGLGLLKIAKTSENATDYSLQNTTKQALFLPTSREVKYKAKAAIDTFFVRIGDATAAALVAVGIHSLGFTATTFAFTNLGVIVLWLAFNVGIAKGHKQLEDAGGEKEGAAA